MKRWQVLGRSLVGGWLLWVVWHHSHWSVALCLTLSFIAIEIVVIQVTQIINTVNTAFKKKNDAQKLR